ncbi:MAG: tRNA (guanosine(46)-N7)-methyltransferase TrmB [Bacteroidales bacterium]|nr:tRNA (guanosine(46)-N7)-methyltransferase TrmB [Bacteroidales bacterium]
MISPESSILSTWSVKRKRERFAEMKSFPNVVQPSFEEAFRTIHPLRGNWNRDFFRNENPLVLELGCGKGEYTVGLARILPAVNFIGIDIKGARIWKGAKTAVYENIPNAGFLRTRIEFTGSFFAPNEVSEIWLTFPDPQPEKKRKRLTAPKFLNLYRSFLRDNGIVHLKTDNTLLYSYTLDILRHNNIEIIRNTDNLYAASSADPILSIRTYYENQYIEQNLSIHYICFRLPHDKNIEEIPDA